MDTPYAIQQYLLSLSLITNLVGNKVYLLELGADVCTGVVDPTIEQQMPFECVVIKAAGGPALHGQVLPLNDLHLDIISYGQTAHLAYNVDSAVYQALKYLKPSIWANTYLHWAKPLTRAIQLRDPTTEWPYVVSVWQTLASDVTIAA